MGCQVNYGISYKTKFGILSLLKLVSKDFFVNYCNRSVTFFQQILILFSIHIERRFSLSIRNYGMILEFIKYSYDEFHSN